MRRRVFLGCLLSIVTGGSFASAAPPQQTSLDALYKACLRHPQFIVSPRRPDGTFTIRYRGCRHRAGGAGR